MAVTITPVFYQALNNPSGLITSALTTTVQTLFTAGSNGSKVTSLQVMSNDSSARDIYLYISDGITTRQTTRITVPAQAGNTTGNTNPPVNLLNNTQWPSVPYDQTGNKYLTLQAGWTIKAAAVVTLTSSTWMDFTGTGANL